VTGEPARPEHPLDMICRITGNTVWVTMTSMLIDECVGMSKGMPMRRDDGKVVLLVPFVFSTPADIPMSDADVPWHLTANSHEYADRL
jgi:hypothetical protein